MNIIAIDIGNSNITVGLFLDGREDFIESVSGDSTAKVTRVLKSAWAKVPFVKRAKVKKRDGVFVASSVKLAWTRQVRRIVKEQLGEKILVIGTEVPLPMELAVDEPGEVGTDRIVSASAAYAVAENAVVVADFGTAVTIDMVDNNGVFLGGVIFPGFEAASGALKANTARLPKVKVKKPGKPFGTNTRDAINCGLYYSAVGALEDVVRRFAEQLRSWPQTLITGGGAEVIKDDCEFVDAFVPHLVVKGIVLAYQKYLEEHSSGTNG